MAVPKRKVSNSRRKMRRSHHALKAKNISECPNCGNARLPHRVCLSCGHYRGSEVLTVNQE